VRRRSTIDREIEVADLIADRDRSSLTAAELAANEAALRRAGADLVADQSAARDAAACDRRGGQWPFFIRQNSVRFRRDEDLTARRDLEATLNALAPKAALQIIPRLRLLLASRQYCRGSAPPSPGCPPLPAERSVSSSSSSA